MANSLFVHLRVATSALTLLFLHAPARVPTFWERLATCETGHIGQPADGRPRWNWGELGLLRLYPHAYLAPPPVQVRVAEYGFARGGYWGCNR